MDNIIFEKIYEEIENDFIELKITGISEYVQAYQTCYVGNESLALCGKRISKYSHNFSKECYVEIGSKEGNFTPAFSMKFYPANSSGHVKIELDIEIYDNKERKNRCCFYIESELGMVENLGKHLQDIAEAKRTNCSLHPIEDVK